ncbi:MAG: serine/threonine-protein kinase [Kofleriaceae bacterium]
MVDDDDSPEDLGSAASLLEALAEAPGLEGGGPLPPGRIVGGKYRVERVVGHGGMGVVYLARDVRLQREVALKLGVHVSPAALARIEREAQVLAKLSHPNVVVIYEVGEVDGRLFVAMEYVDGGTARSWATAERSVAEIVRLYAAAGDGLAAAHAAGIIHRDFKPDNVLVGKDGRPRVADFGLARELGVAIAETSDGADSPPSESPDAVVTTRGPVGTPAYMSPEQRDAAPVDARADQFAFCATVWEALYGARRGAPAKRERRVPPHVVAALERGTSVLAETRWPSMSALLAELRRDPHARRRRVAVAGLAVAAVGLAVALPIVAQGGDDPCMDGAELMAPVWNASRSAEVARTLGPQLFPIARQRLDGFARSWIDGERAACRATRVTGSASEAMLDRRMACLHRARARLDAVVGALVRTDAASVEHAPDQLTLLPDLATCADVTRLGAQAALPADRGARALIDGLEAQLAEAGTRSIRDEPISEASADRLVALARSIAWPPLVAEATHVRALALEQTNPTGPVRAAFETAAAAALASAADTTAAYVMADLAWNLAGSGKYAEALTWAELAEAMRTRLGGDPALGARIAGARASAIAAGPHPADALAARRRQVELARAAFSDPLSEATNHLSLAIGYRAAGQRTEALREAELGLAQAEAVLGKDHPKLRGFLEAASQYAAELGKLDIAAERARRAIAILERWYGPNSEQLVGMLSAKGAIEQRQGDLPAARATSERALAIEQRADPTSAHAGGLEMNLGMFAAQFGELDEAARHAARALAILEAVWGDDSPQLVDLYVLVGYVAREQHRLDDAITAFRRAVALADASDGMVDPVNPRIEMSYTLLLQHRAADAVALLSPMLAVIARGETPPPAVAELHLALARALWDAGDRTKARTEATASREAWAALGPPYENQRAQAASWLRDHH